MRWFAPGLVWLLVPLTACGTEPELSKEPVRQELQALQATPISPSDGQVGDRFGEGVATFGDRAIVGSTGRDSEEQYNAGALYLYVRDGQDWVESEPPLLLPVATEGIPPFFGAPIAVSGEFAVVGVSALDRAYVVAFDGTTPAEVVAELKPAEVQADNSGFGWSVDISGETILVGAESDDLDAEDQGAAYVFVRDGADWVEQARLVASDGREYDGFGNAVAISGDTAVIGARMRNANERPTQTSAYVFVRENATWIQQGEALIAADGKASDFFVNDVAISGDTIVVGAQWADVGGRFDQGAAHIFVREGTDFIQNQPALSASDGLPQDYFGEKVDIWGDFVLINSGDALTTQHGSVYLFGRDGSGFQEQDQLTGSADREAFGLSIAIADKILIVGAPGSGIAYDRPGGAYIFDLPPAVDAPTDGGGTDGSTTDATPTQDTGAVTNRDSASVDGNRPTTDAEPPEENQETGPPVEPLKPKGCDCRLIGSKRHRTQWFVGITLPLLLALRRRRVPC